MLFHVRLVCPLGGRIPARWQLDKFDFRPRSSWIETPLAREALDLAVINIQQALQTIKYKGGIKVRAAGCIVDFKVKLDVTSNQLLAFGHL